MGVTSPAQCILGHYDREKRAIELGICRTWKKENKTLLFNDKRIEGSLGSEPSEDFWVGGGQNMDRLVRMAWAKPLSKMEDRIGSCERRGETGRERKAELV